MDCSPKRKQGTVAPDKSTATGVILSPISHHRAGAALRKPQRGFIP